MLTIYSTGRGGKHRATADAAHWRALTAHLVRQFSMTHPEMESAIIQAYAEDEARLVTRALNQKRLQVTLGADL